MTPCKSPASPSPAVDLTRLQSLAAIPLLLLLLAVPVLADTRHTGDLGEMAASGQLQVSSKHGSAKPPARFLSFGLHVKRTPQTPAGAWQIILPAGTIVSPSAPAEATIVVTREATVWLQPGQTDADLLNVSVLLLAPQALLPSSTSQLRFGSADLLARLIIEDTDLAPPMIPGGGASRPALLRQHALLQAANPAGLPMLRTIFPGKTYELKPDETQKINAAVARAKSRQAQLLREAELNRQRLDALKDRAKAGEAPAILELADVHALGLLGTRRNDAEAIRLLTSLAESGNPDAQVRLGILLHTTKPEARDYAAGRRWLEAAGQKSSAAAWDHLGQIYRHGIGVDSNPKEAEAMFKKAIELGYAPAEKHLREMRLAPVAKLGMTLIFAWALATSSGPTLPPAGSDALDQWLAQRSQVVGKDALGRPVTATGAIVY